MQLWHNVVSEQLARLNVSSLPVLWPKPGHGIILPFAEGQAAWAAVVLLRCCWLSVSEGIADNAAGEEPAQPCCPWCCGWRCSCRAGQLGGSGWDRSTAARAGAREFGSSVAVSGGVVSLGFSFGFVLWKDLTVYIHHFTPWKSGSVPKAITKFPLSLNCVYTLKSQVEYFVCFVTNWRDFFSLPVFFFFFFFFSAVVTCDFRKRQRKSRSEDNQQTTRNAWQTINWLLSTGISYSRLPIFF